MTLLVASAIVFAEPTPALNVKSLVDAADFVVLGTITELTDLGLVSLDGSSDNAGGRLLTGRILVRQALKGRPLADSIEFWSPVWHMAVSRIARNSDGIFLLRRRGQGLEFVSPYYPMLVAAPGTRVMASSPLDGVAEAIAATLRTSATSASSKREASYMLSQLSSAESLAGLRLATRDRDRSVQLAATAALLIHGQVDALPLAEEALLRPGIESSEALHNLRVGLKGLKDPTAIPALTRLLSRGDTDTRRAVAVALGNTRSPAALRALNQALDDEDFEVRYNAVQSLAEATGQTDLRTNHDQFREEETKRVSEWKKRLAAQGVQEQ